MGIASWPEQAQVVVDPVPVEDEDVGVSRRAGRSRRRETHVPLDDADANAVEQRLPPDAEP